MTAYSKTVRNKLYPFSNAGAISIWGTELWGGFWGYEPVTPPYNLRHVVVASGPVLSSTRGAFDIMHIMAASGPVLSSAKGAFGIVHYMVADSILPTDQTSRQWTYFLQADGLVLTSDPASETLNDQNGYQYVFGNSANAKNRPLTSYATATVSDVTWASGNGTLTVWS
jgi:hypothetical protein